MATFGQIQKSLSSDRQSLRADIDARVYPNWMARVLPVFNFFRSLFGYETFVNFSSPSLEGRNIVLLKSDAVRLDASIKKEEKITAVFQIAVNETLSLQQRKAAVETLTDPEDLVHKTSLLESLNQIEEMVKLHALEKGRDLRQRYAYADLLPDEVKASVKQEIKFDVAEANALDRRLKIPQRLENLKSCRESDRANIEKKIRHDERQYEAAALNKTLSTQTRQANAGMLPQERQTELLKIIEDDRFKAIKAIALDKRKSFADRLEAADLLPDEVKASVKQEIKFDVAEANALDRRLKIPQRLENLKSCRESDRASIEEQIRQDERQYEAAALNKTLSTQTRQANAVMLPQERQTELLKIIEADRNKAIALDKKKSFAERSLAASRLTGEDRERVLKTIAWDQGAAAILQERKRQFPQVAPKPRIYTEEEMALRQKAKITRAKQEFVSNVAEIKSTVRAQMVAIENLGFTPVHARVCPKVFLRLSEDFMT